MRDNVFSISSGKSAAVILTTKRRYGKPVFTYNGEHIELNTEYTFGTIEYHLSSVLGFGKHIEVVSGKAQQTASALSRLMPNIGGSCTAKRKLLTSVVHSQLLYAVPVSQGALAYENYRKKLYTTRGTLYHVF